MQFELTDVQKDIQKAAREFAQKEFESEIALELEKEAQFPRSLFEKACRLGFVGIEYPESCGGQGFGLFESILVTEEFTRKDSSLGIALSLADMGSGLVFRYGDENQRKRFLLPIAEGKNLLPAGVLDLPGGRSQSLVSKEVDSKLAAIICKGRSWVPLGSSSDPMVVIDGESDTGRPMAAILEKDSKGVIFSQVKKTMGMRIAPVVEINFDHVEIPKEYVLAGSRGTDDPLTTYHHLHRIKTAGQALGIAQCALDRAVKHAREREQFGRRISQFQGIQFMMADLYTQVEAARSLVYRAAYDYDIESPELENISSVAKLFATGVAVRGAVDSIQIHGGVGLMKEYSIERLLRDAKTIQNLEEGNLIQKALIGKRVALSANA